MSNPGPKDDTEDSLREIAERHGKPIIDLLLESEERTVKASKYTEFIQNLAVFVPRRNRKRARDGDEEKETYLHCHEINAFKNHNYLALSYTWEPSDYEAHEAKSYVIQRPFGQSPPFELSPVRDVVFDRVIKYMHAVGVNYFWIDRHSIEQETMCDQPDCSHELCIRKRDAMHVVDLVYKESNYPVALLGMVVESASDLILFHDLLGGQLTVKSAPDGEYYSIRAGKDKQAKETLQLLKCVTSDLWWTRAWTFQENYRGGNRMQLLMRHSPSLEIEKQLHSVVFGCIEGELRFNSAHFSEEATKLCQALSPRFPELPAGERGDMVKSVLDALGRYTVILGEEESMSTAVIENVNARGLKDPWDRLSIIANCCQYSRRIEWPQTRVTGSHSRSLSAALMAQYLVNGEILYNGKYPPDTPRDIASMPVAQALKNLAFDDFRAPLDDANRTWSHNKRCRFVKPRIIPPGIVAEGHLWKLDGIIDTEDAHPQWVSKHYRRDLFLKSCKLLMWLANYLQDCGYENLARELRKFIYTNYPQGNFPSRYMITMANELSDAIADGKRLILGRLWQSHGQDQVDESGTDESAVFILDEVWIQGQRQND